MPTTRRILSDFHPLTQAQNLLRPAQATTDTLSSITNQAAAAIISGVKTAAPSISEFRKTALQIPGGIRQVKTIHSAMSFLSRLKRKVESVQTQSPSLQALKLQTSIDCSTQFQTSISQDLFTLTRLREELEASLDPGLTLAPINDEHPESSAEAMALNLLKKLKQHLYPSSAQLQQLTAEGDFGSSKERELEQIVLNAVRVKARHFLIDAFSSEMHSKAALFKLRLLLEVELPFSKIGSSLLAHLGTGAFLIHLSQEGSSNTYGIAAVLVRHAEGCFLYDPRSGLYDLGQADSPSELLAQWMKGYQFSRLRILRST